MENKGLLFIPDISGFTRFINQTEIAHSRLIIQELLEILIDSNLLKLEVSEIEGDAILFYKWGESPSPEELYHQVEKMYCEFNRHILAYDLSRYCYCKACESAIDLKLKIISHYGEFTSYKVKEFSKLIGKDVIIAHQLLKNEIENHEYWLLTKNLLNNPEGSLSHSLQWTSSAKDTESGQIPFYYTQLSLLKNKIQPVTMPPVQLSDKTKMFSVSKEYDTDIISLFHAVGDFNFRYRWMEGVKKVEEVNHYLPRVGMRCRYILDNGESVIYSTSYSYSPDRIEFTESDEKSSQLTHFILQKIDEKKSRLTIDYFLKKNIFNQILFNLKRKPEMEKAYQRSLLNITDVIKEIHLTA